MLALYVYNGGNVFVPNGLDNGNTISFTTAQLAQLHVISVQIK